MGVILIKLLLTPALMLVVSMVSRRWGNLAGGIACGLPLTSGPISVYLAVEQGTGFASYAAANSLTGINGVLACYLGYIFLSKYVNITLSCAIAILVFGAVNMLMLHAPIWLDVVVSIVIIYIIIVITAGVGDQVSKSRIPPFDLPARAIVATLLVLAVTASAGALGPQVVGIISPVPVIAWPLIIFGHVQDGRDGAIAAIRGAAGGAVSLIIFYLIVAQITGDRQVALYIVAVLASIVVSVFVGVYLSGYRIK